MISFDNGGSAEVAVTSKPDSTRVEIHDEAFTYALYDALKLAKNAGIIEAVIIEGSDGSRTISIKGSQVTITIP